MIDLRSCICGVDPGLSGGIALLDPQTDKLIAVIDMPQIKRGSRSDLDLHSLAPFIAAHAAIIKYAVIEDVGAMPGQGVTGMFTFGKVTGIVVGMLAAHFIPIYYVKPSVWKNVMGLSKDKKASIKKANELYRDESFGKTDDGMAEAALIAHFGKRFYNV